MTSRRSMATYSERVSRALQFVPGHVGGRVASAQPIRRRGGTLRSASVGATAVPPPVPPTYLGLETWPVAVGDAETDVSFWFATSYGLFSAGDTAVILLSMFGGTPTAPTGWTTLVSGSIASGSNSPGLSYLACASTVTLDATVTVPTGITAGWNDDPTGVGVGTIFMLPFSGTTGRTLQCSTPATEVGSATSHPLEEPSGAWLTSWSVLATTEAAATGGTMHGLVVPSGLSGHYDAGMKDNTNDDRRVILLNTEPGYAFGSKSVGTCATGAPGTPLAGTSATWAMGWT